MKIKIKTTFLITSLSILLFSGCGKKGYSGNNVPVPPIKTYITEPQEEEEPPVVEEEPIVEEEPVEEEPPVVEEEPSNPIDGTPLIYNYMDTYWKLIPPSIENKERSDSFERASLGRTQSYDWASDYQSNFNNHLFPYLNDVKNHILSLDQQGYIINIDTLESLIIIYRSEFLFLLGNYFADESHFGDEEYILGFRQILVDGVYEAFDTMTISLLGYVID